MTNPRLVNLTPHQLRVVDHNGATVLDLPPPDIPARIGQTTVAEQHLGPTRVPLRTIRYGPPTSLPEQTDNTILIVSRVVAQELDRPDLVFPDEEIRDNNGRITGCRALARFRA
jgi:hypothetical protein